MSPFLPGAGWVGQIEWWLSPNNPGPAHPADAFVNELARGDAQLVISVVSGLAELGFGWVDVCGMSFETADHIGAAFTGGEVIPYRPISSFATLEPMSFGEHIYNNGTNYIYNALPIHHAVNSYQYAVNPTPEGAIAMQQSSASLLPYIFVDGFVYPRSVGVGPTTGLRPPTSFRPPTGNPLIDAARNAPPIGEPVSIEPITGVDPGVVDAFMEQLGLGTIDLESYLPKPSKPGPIKPVDYTPMPKPKPLPPPDGDFPLAG